MAVVEGHIAVIVACMVAVDNFVAVEKYTTVEADRDIGTAVPDICC